MSDLTLYTNPMSRGRIARRMLEELGEPYEAVVLDYGAGMKDASYLAVNPMGKVPTLRHGDVVVTECAAICAYLADAFPVAGLAPALADPQRGAYLRWMFFAAGPVEAAVTNHSLGWIPKGAKEEGRVGYGTLGRVTDAIERLVSGAGPWLLGERFTALDVYLGSQIAWGLAFGTMEARPGFAAYVERLNARPAAVEAKKLDDALMA